MASYTLLSDYGRYKAGSLLTDEAGDPIASMIANGVPIVPTVAALQATAAQVKDTFGRPSCPEWQASAVLGSLLVVRDEGTVVNARPSIDFRGAAVTVVDDPANNCIRVTVAAETTTGWTDGGTLVYVTDTTDEVAIGIQAMEGTEKVRVVHDTAVVLALESRNGGAGAQVGCTVGTYFARSTGAVDGDTVHRASHSGHDDTAVTPLKVEYGREDWVALDVSAGTEDGAYDLWLMTAGALAQAARFTGAGQEFVRAGAAAAGAATQRRSRVAQFTGSMWTGAAAVERDIQVYACPSTLGFDETGVARMELAFDYEGWRLLMLRPATAAATPVAVPGAIFRSDAPSGPPTIFEWRATANVVSPAHHTCWTDQDGVESLFAVDGDGAFSPAGGTAAGAATQAASRRHRWEASMWTGAAEALRDWDVVARPSSVAVDEAGGARTWLAFDFEDNPILQLFTDGAAGGNPIVRSSAADGATPGIEFRTSGDFGAANPAYRFTDAEGAGVLFDILGDGVSVFTRAADAAVGYELQLYQLSASPAQNDIIASFAGYGRSTLPAKVKFGSLDFYIDDPTTGAIDGAFRVRVVGNNVETSLVEGKYDHASGAFQLGFFGAAPVPKQSAATPNVAEIKAGLVALGLFNA